MKPDGTCHAFNGENRCTKELIIGQKPFIDWYDRANPEFNNYNWEMFITEDGYEGRAPNRPSPFSFSVSLPVLISVPRRSYSRTNFWPHFWSHYWPHVRSYFRSTHTFFHARKGQLDAYCNGVREASGGRIFEEWVVYCDDNNNGELDEDELNVQFETIYDYVYTGDDPKHYKGTDKNIY